MPILRVLALSIVLAGCGSCGAAFSPPADEPGLSLSDQEAITVKIYSCGGTGSGFLVSPHHVVTAAHVVSDCGSYIIELADGQRRLAALEAMYRRDIARLVLDEPVDIAVAVPMATPIAGDVACFTPGTPHRILTCGEVRSLDWSLWRGEIRIAGQVVKGNSGSPLFDSRGRLIGVVVTCDTFDGTKICLPLGGGASSFQGARWLVEDTAAR